MPSNQVLIDPGTNHVISASYSYDADGDMTSDGLHTYSYDGCIGLIMSMELPTLAS